MIKPTFSKSVFRTSRESASDSALPRPAVRLAAGVTLGVLALGAFTQVTVASREVLSDLDCVVEPSAVVDLGAAVPGMLEAARFDRSDYVSAGTVMARLESGVEEVAVAIATQVAESDTAIQLRAATSGFGSRTLSRNEVLAENNSVSTQVLDQVKTEAGIAALQLRQEREEKSLAQLELERAKAQLERRVIRSPIDGSVIERFHAAGEYVDAEAVYRVAQLDPLHVEVIVPIEYLDRLESGMNAGVTLAVPGFEGEEFAATVRRIDSVADAASATYGVRLILENPELSIPSGVRCSVDFFAS